MLYWVSSKLKYSTEIETWNRHSLKAGSVFGVGKGGGTCGKILAIAWVFFLASSLITQVGNMFVKIQLFHQDFFENPSLLFWKWVAKSLCLCQDCTRKKHTYWLTSILFLWYHLKSLTEVLGNYFLVHIGFFPTLWEVLSSAWLTIFAASIRKNISHRNILRDSWNYMPILVPSSAKRILTQILVITKLDGRKYFILIGFVYDIIHPYKDLPVQS